MRLIKQFRQIVIALSLVLVLVTTSACGTATQAREPLALPGSNSPIGYGQVERGNTRSGQEFGNWVVQTSRGLIQDAYVRGDDKLGAVISPKVRPNEVRPLAQSLVQGFHQNAPKRDLTVLMYAPDKKLILTAKYNDTTRQIEYQ
ncbi:hypothetical protein ACN4EK_01320 [Pantanalinema rosaneae CENA516]|uniref:hypothetical protein n=1 Tax=Pantanalinema rosaneae TaxID=1620701 RepID=UPI003D6E66A3